MQVKYLPLSKDAQIPVAVCWLLHLVRWESKMLLGALLRSPFGNRVQCISLILLLNTPRVQKMCYEVLQLAQNASNESIQQDLNTIY